MQRCVAPSTKPILFALVLACASLTPAVTTRAQPQRDAEPVGVSGYVLAPDGTPVSGGRAGIRSAGMAGASASIERDGRFRLVPNMAGIYLLSINTPDLAPYDVIVDVPPSRTLRLPVIRLLPATYFRARFLTRSGEPILAPFIRRQSLSVNSVAFHDPTDTIDGDGTITIGPLPRGVTTLALDSPPLAQTRLRDLNVTGAETLLDGGTVIVQPGAVLHVDVVDDKGHAVRNHLVGLEDSRSPSPIEVAPPPPTNEQGRATFDRLGDGRYWLRASTSGLCDNRHLSIARLVTVPSSGTLLTRLIVDGHATFRLTSNGNPLRGASISASPDDAPPSLPAALRGLPNFPAIAALPVGRSRPGCSGTTDDDGRVTLRTFPPGPARLEVRLQHSMYVRRVNVPEGDKEIPIDIPGGFLPVRVTTTAGTGRVAGAALAWMSGGARVETTTEANGEALLESVGRTEGTLTITARGFEPVQLTFSEPPAELQEITIEAVPATRLQLRVVTSSGEPLPRAVVELSTDTPSGAGQITVTNPQGFASFADAPRGALRLLASADAFVSSGLHVSDDTRDGIVLPLSRGYRVIVNVELSPEAGPHRVRVMNEAGASMDAFLDAASDRRMASPGRLSLGPLAPGRYAIELQGTRERWQERVQIVDRDVSVTVR